MKREAALPDAVERHRAAAGAQRGGNQSSKNDQHLPTGKPEQDGGQSGKAEREEDRKTEPDRGGRHPGRPQGKPAGSRPHQRHEAIRHGQ